LTICIDPVKERRVHKIAAKLMKPRFFKSSVRFRRWLESNHASVTELWVGFYKKGSGKTGVTYLEAVDEALCFGWIDGLVRGLDEIRYMQRFTPRKKTSTWSLINLAKVRKLTEQGRMHPAGLKAHAARDPKRTGIYSFENAARKLAPGDQKKFRANKAAWNFFQAQPPGYRRTASWWVTSAKKAETKVRRLEQLIADSAAQRRLNLLSPRIKPGKRTCVRGAGR
jgi:uncharacterized protein YdeI (YjbR/CyaY-like superfamily)